MLLNITKKFNLHYGWYRTYEKKMSFKYTYKIYKKKYGLNIKLIDASKIFLKKLKNISNPEKKEKLLGVYLLRYLREKQKNIKT